MALINCGECKTEMSDKADKCPKCGAPAKKKTSLFTWIVVGFLGIGFIGALTGNKSSTPPPETTTSASTSTPEKLVNEPLTPEKFVNEPSKPEWSYSNDPDMVSGKEISQANMMSINSFEMEFPYQGGTFGHLSVRKHPRYGKDIMFIINKGQLHCTSYDGCQVSVRFDDNKPFKVHANEPEDNSNTVLFLSGYDKLLKQIRTSKTMIIEATFYQNGERAFEFDVSNLNFE